MTPTRCYIGLGANLGDALATLRQAADVLAGLPRSRLVALSSPYRTAPIESSGPDYFNAVAALDTELSPQELIGKLQELETAYGRERPYRNAPRTLDLDILLFGELVLHEPGLTLPHPRLHERAFVLHPLLELVPALVHPTLGPLQGHLPAVRGQAIERLAAWS